MERLPFILLGEVLRPALWLKGPENWSFILATLSCSWGNWGPESRRSLSKFRREWGAKPGLKQSRMRRPLLATGPQYYWNKIQARIPLISPSGPQAGLSFPGGAAPTQRPEFESWLCLLILCIFKQVVQPLSSRYGIRKITLGVVKAAEHSGEAPQAHLSLDSTLRTIWHEQVASTLGPPHPLMKQGQ